MKHLYQLSFFSKTLFFRYSVFFLLFFISLNSSVIAQCPDNIDFEQGTFNNWQCYSTGGFTGGVPNPLPTVPIPGRHDMLSFVPGNGRDPWGNFPKNCPNGSGYSVKIGDDILGHGQNVDAVSYTFTIPATQNKFSLTYYYALVFNQGATGSHNSQTQPAFRVKVYNLTDGGEGPCPLDSMTANSQLPGFNSVPSGNGPIFYKPWAAASINLDGMAGKTFQIRFMVNGCGLGGGTHFGYAYVDIGAQCTSGFDGAVFCPDDTAVTVSAPFGYQAYNWYDGTGTVLLGTGQTLTLIPPPLSGDSVKVELVPFNGYGCLDTLTAYLWDTLTVTANAGADAKTCDNNPVQLGGPPEPNRVYKWTPATGLSNPNIANPIATPTVTTPYTLTVTNINGGCATSDEVRVTVDVVSDSIEQIGPTSHCTNTGQTVRLKVLPHDVIQWYRNGIPEPGAITTDYVVTQTGDYHAVVSSLAGCSRTTAVKHIDIWESPVIGFSTPTAVQCFNNHSFVFTNSSSLNTGILQYAWDLGDGNSATTRDVTHSYIKDGSYRVKLLITAPGGCIDSAFTNVTVNPSPVSAFTVDAPEQCFKDNFFMFNTKSTVPSGILTYLWDFGDGSTNNSNDIAHRYTIPGTYNVRLTATETNGGCADDSVVQVIVHPSPIADFVVNNATQCFPGHNFILQNNSTVFSGTLNYLWSFGDGNTSTTAAPSHTYNVYGAYTIKLVADAGGVCKDSTTRNIEIYPVPAADFSVQPVCQDLRVPVINRTTNISTSTVNYFWDFGNGHLDNAQTPVYTYTTPGTYTITLRVSTAQCPVSFNTISKTVEVERKLPGITYPDKLAFYNYDLKLQARNIGTTATWDPPTSLSNRFSFSPTFRGIAPQLYTIQLKTAGGCVTVDTQLVKTEKKIEIYVPNGFTPGNDYLNERLRPVLIGFAKVNYFRIYNRWGKLLFSMNSDQPGWDGKVNGDPVNMQTVVWMIEAVDVDGKVHQKKGTTVVIR